MAFIPWLGTVLKLLLMLCQLRKKGKTNRQFFRKSINRRRYTPSRQSAVNPITFKPRKAGVELKLLRLGSRELLFGKLVEEYCRGKGKHSVLGDQAIPQAEFAYKSSINRSTRKFPFQVVYGRSPNSVLDLVPLPSGSH